MDVYRPFNFAIRGQSVEYIKGIVDDFALETATKVDVRVLRPIANERDRFYTRILSVGYDYAIKRTLQEAGFSSVFDQVIANRLESIDGKALGFTLDIYGKKPKVLKKFLDMKDIKESETVYLGDTEDDEPIAEMLPPGHFIVPFLATDEFRQKMASKHKAFVPESEEDLQKYLSANKGRKDETTDKRKTDVIFYND